MIEAASTFKHASQRLHATRSLGALFQALTADDLGGRSAPQKLTPRFEALMLWPTPLSLRPIVAF